MDYEHHYLSISAPACVEVPEKKATSLSPALAR